MNYSLTTVGGHADIEGKRRFEILGAVCHLASKSRLHAPTPVRQMIERLRMPIALDQIEVFYNDFGRCMGYVTWAYLCPNVEQRLLRGENLALHDFEWNEGSSLWIIDLLVPYGSIRHVMAQMRDQLFTRSTTLTYFRHKNGRRICKRLSRADKSCFWSSHRMAGST